MFCQQCGKQVPDHAQHCPACGARAGGGAALARELTDRARAASQDAFGAFKTLAADPVGGLQPAFSGLGPERALAAGVVFAVFFALCFALGITIGLQRYLGWLSHFVTGGNSGLVQFAKAFLVGAVPPAALVASSTLARTVFRGAGSTAGDLFTAGAALLPVGLVVLIGSLIGVGNFELVLVLAVFANSYAVLILYSGCTGIAGLSPGGAALAVPVMVVASTFLTKVVLAAMW